MQHAKIPANDRIKWHQTLRNHRLTQTGSIHLIKDEREGAIRRFNIQCGGSRGVVAVLLSDRRDQIGIGDNKENKKHVLGARRLADKAALDHAFMMRAYRV